MQHLKYLLSRARKQILRAYCSLRFGKITSETKSVDGGVVSEVAYYDRRGRTCGYWAYGCFDPALPYRGQGD